MNILVTGSTRGIGRAITRRLDENGAHVLGLYRRRHDAAASLQTLCSPRLTLTSCDLGDRSFVTSWAEQLPQVFNGLVLNAGIATRAPFTQTVVDGHDPLLEQVNLDLIAPLWILRAMLVAGKIEDGASVVFVTSNLSQRGLEGKIAYSAAKAGLEGACRGLARELGPRNIRVNAVAPGLLATDMTVDMGDQGYAQYAQEVPLGRVGCPEDIAGVVSFLLSEASGYVSGQVLNVDGGWSA